MLELDNVVVAYREKPVVCAVSLTVEAGEIGCLLGPSGCGKTTLLRAVAGFEPVRSGAIRLAGAAVSRPGQTVPPERRGVGMVFQDYALFPHLTVEANVRFGLRGRPREEARARAERLLGLVGLAERRDAYPHQLSGGQQQRIALARALAPGPQLLLLDEPFSGLDVELRESLARDVRRILKEEGITALLVTHDQLEAFAVADRIGVMADGCLLQWDSAYNLYHRPTARFVADFVGQGVLLPGTVTGDGRISTEIGTVGGDLPEHCRPGCRVEVLIRPDDLVDAEQGVPAEVTDRAFRGADFLYTLRLPSGAQVLCLTHSHHRYAVGDTVHLRPEVKHAVVFPADVQGETRRKDAEMQRV